MGYNEVMKDKYSAVWVSYSSISDFIVCPKAYYYKNIYKDPKTGHKITVMSPPLALGQIVHEVVEALSVLPVDKRFAVSLLEKFNQAWGKVAGKNGGFLNKTIEGEYKKRGKEMLRRLEKNPGPLKKLAVKIQMDLPYYWLSEKDNIILCGKIDWLEYIKTKDSVHIIDFKTGKKQEKEGSLQLPIYYLLVSNTQKRPVIKASYWYIGQSNKLAVQKLPDIKKAEEKIFKIAKEIKLARQLNRFKCPTDGCRECKRMEKIIDGKGEFIRTDDFGRDIYILPNATEKDTDGKVL